VDSSSRRVIPPLTIGQRVEVGLSRPGEDTQWLPTRIEDEDGSGQWLTVAWPTDHGRLVYVRLGQTIELAASAPGDALYSSHAKISAARNAAVPLLDLEVLGDWRRLQRREAVRISVSIRPRLAERIIGDSRKPFRAGISNISATGLQVRSHEELRIGDHVMLAFVLPDGVKELTLESVVRRVDILQHVTPQVWQAGCQFVTIDAAQSEQIVQFIFAQQRALARLRR
jgi:c-di-GMP-binding flagellar brake protein YcgR